jgi:hypothetical protein
MLDLLTVLDFLFARFERAVFLVEVPFGMVCSRKNIALRQFLKLP